jgi:peptidyl-dipeptidase Dcp
MELMLRVWKPAREQALKDRDAIAQMMQADGAGADVQPWDWSFYAERVRKAQFDLDETALKPYFQLDRMIEAVFYTATRLHGLQFAERKDLKGWHPDVRAWEVKSAKGEHLAIFYGDYFARPTKRSGAWMNSYRDQQKLDGKPVTAIVANHCNFNKPAPGQPALLSYDDARTLFHEFGHALHGLMSNVTYPTLSGTSVPRDFVELPSQINEHWLGTDDVLKKFAVHAQTGAPMPADLLAKLRKAGKFDQGFATVEFVASALVDMEFHLLNETKPIDPAAFEKQILAKIGMPSAITMRHRSPHFSHIFGGGYAAGYYSYLWAEVLDADGFEAFEESGDPFHPDLARRLREQILSVGNSRDLMEAYRQFRGKTPSVEPLLRKRGLAN